MTLIARFQVDGYEPRQVAGLDADWFGLMTFAKTFTAGIVGHATGWTGSARIVHDDQGAYFEINLA